MGHGTLLTSLSQSNIGDQGNHGLTKKEKKLAGIIQVWSRSSRSGSVLLKILLKNPVILKTQVLIYNKNNKNKKAVMEYFSEKLLLLYFLN